VKVVLDASAALATVLLRDGSAGILDLLEQASVVLAPDLYASEVANGLWKYVWFENLSIEMGTAALESAMGLVDQTLPVADLCQEALREAANFGHPVYDLCYAVAARREGAAVLTIDRKLVKLLSRMKIRSLKPRSSRLP
jgi:predicted nucleic acid-binding protein